MRSRCATLVAVAAAFWMSLVAGLPGLLVQYPAATASFAAEPAAIESPGSEPAAIESAASGPFEAELFAAEPAAATSAELPDGAGGEVPAPPRAERDASDDPLGPPPRRAAESSAVAVPSPRETAPGRLVRVELVDGRTFDGTIDPRTDGAELWLCRQHGTASVRRPIGWSLVSRAELAGQSLSAAELRAAVEQVRAESPPAAAISPQTKTLSMRCLAAPAVVAGIEPLEAPAIESPEAPRHDGRQTGRVEWLAVEATAANWDADVESDGLLLVVEPRDAAGHIAPVRGWLDVELIGRRWGTVRRPQPYGRMGHWSVSVEPADFGPLGARYRLAFQGVHPEFDARVAPHGAIHARLSVPGRGVFEASHTAVRLRPYSAVRDEQQQFTAGRFFPGERVSGRGR